MEKNNTAIVNRFFEAYGRHDQYAIQQVVSENIKWKFPGRNPLSGTKIGIEEVLKFFDTMGNIMGQSEIKVEKLIVQENDFYLLECQHIWTNREDGINLDHHWCVLWKFEDGKLVEGKHFSEDQYEVDEFFRKICQVVTFD